MNSNSISIEIITELYTCSCDFFKDLLGIMLYKDNGVQERFKGLLDENKLRDIVWTISNNRDIVIKSYKDCGYENGGKITDELLALHYKNAAIISSQMGNIFSSWLKYMLDDFYPKEINKFNQLTFLDGMSNIDLGILYSLCVQYDQQKNLSNNDRMVYRFSIAVYNYLHYGLLNMLTISRKYSYKHLKAKSAGGIDLFNQNAELITSVVDSAKDVLRNVVTAQKEGNNKEEIMADAADRLVSGINVPPELKVILKGLVGQMAKGDIMKQLDETVKDIEEQK